MICYFFLVFLVLFISSFIFLVCCSVTLAVVCHDLFLINNFLFLDDNSCFTSRREPGQCVDIRKCNYMVKLLSSNSRNPEVISYLQKSTCGFAGRYPMICCPNSNAPNVRVDNNGKEETSIFPRRPHCGLSNVTNSRIVGGAPAVLSNLLFYYFL